MSIYDTVKAKFDPAPPYPTKSNFETFYGYRAGNVLGSYISRDAAMTAGATVVEKVVDEASFKAAKEEYRIHGEKVYAAWVDEMSPHYGEFNKAQFRIIVGDAYTRGHSGGFEEVESLIEELALFSAKIIAAANK